MWNKAETNYPHMNMLMLILEKPNSKKKPNSMGKKELAGLRENSLSPSSRNNGS